MYLRKSKCMCVCMYVYTILSKVLVPLVINYVKTIAQCNYIDNLIVQ